MSLRDRMMVRCLLAVLTMSVISSQGEPLNLLVGDLHFVRPENWSWQAPSAKSVADTILVVSHPSDDTKSAVVMFKEGPRDATAMCEAWKGRFPDLANTAVSTREKRINNRSVTYCEMSGHYAFGNQRHKNHALIGAVIPSTQKFIHVLLIGHPSSVRGAAPEFRKMIESALRETE